MKQRIWRILAIGKNGRQRRRRTHLFDVKGDLNYNEKNIGGKYGRKNQKILKSIVFDSDTDKVDVLKSNIDF